MYNIIYVAEFFSVKAAGVTVTDDYALREQFILCVLSRVKSHSG
jgi:hypothetical protein